MPNPLLEKRLVPWRWLVGGLAFVLAGCPLLFPLFEALQHLPHLDVGEWRRLPLLYGNTLLLLAGTLLLAMPAGIVLAAILFRSDVPGRGVWRGLLGFSLFLPLPIFVSAWQALLGSDGWLPLWENRLGQPWTSGLLPAIWVHALAGLPWVTLFIGIGLTWVERDLEEDGLLRGPPWRVFWRVTLPRAWPMVLAAALFLALQTAGEIAVTDMFLVGTLAEDVYLRFASGERSALALAFFGALPFALLLGVVVFRLGRRLQQENAPLDSFAPAPLVFPLRRLRWPACVLLAFVALLVLLLPLLGLIFKLGRVGPGQWSLAEAELRLLSPLKASGGRVALMILLAVVTSVLTAVAALVAAWLMNGSRCLTWLLGGLALLLAALPAAVVGIALKEMILWLVSKTPAADFFSAVLHDRGPLAVMWAQGLRFWPYALAVFWVLIRLIPREYVESTRLEGRGVSWEGRHLILPLLWRPFVIVVALVTALCLGEVAASSRVETPGWQTPASLLFERMHYGVDGEVAGWALLLLGGVLVLYGLLWLASRVARTLRVREP